MRWQHLVSKRLNGKSYNIYDESVQIAIPCVFNYLLQWSWLLFQLWRRRDVLLTPEKAIKGFSTLKGNQTMPGMKWMWSCYRRSSLNWANFEPAVESSMELKVLRSLDQTSHLKLWRARINNRTNRNYGAFTSKSNRRILTSKRCRDLRNWGAAWAWKRAWGSNVLPHHGYETEPRLPRSSGNACQRDQLEMTSLDVVVPDFPLAELRSDVSIFHKLSLANSVWFRSSGGEHSPQWTSRSPLQ